MKFVGNKIWFLKHTTFSRRDTDISPEMGPSCMARGWSQPEDRPPLPSLGSLPRRSSWDSTCGLLLGISAVFPLKTEGNKKYPTKNIQAARSWKIVCNFCINFMFAVGIRRHRKIFLAWDETPIFYICFIATFLCFGNDLAAMQNGSCFITSSNSCCFWEYDCLVWS